MPPPSASKFSVQSDGLRLEAFHYPADPAVAADRPSGGRALVVQQGFTGMAEMLPRIFATELTGYGFDVYAVNYRGWGGSEGRRRSVIASEMARDVRALLRYVSGRYDPEYLAAAGWGFGAGLVVSGCWDLGLPLIAMNGVYDGAGFHLEHRTPAELDALRQRVRAGMESVAAGEPEPEIPAFEAYPMGPASHEYVSSVLETKDPYDSSDVGISFLDSLLNWYPLGVAERARGPLLVVHSIANDIHALEGAETLAARWGGRSETEWLDGVGHTEWVEPGDPTLVRTARRMVSFADPSTGSLLAADLLH